MKRKFLWFIVAAVLLVALGGFAYSRRGAKPTEVQIAQVGRQDLQAKASANGKIQAPGIQENVAPMSSPVSSLSFAEKCVVGSTIQAVSSVSLAREARAVRRDFSHP